MAKAKKERARRERGSGSVEQRGNKWRIVWREGKRKRSKTFTEESNARAALRVIIGDVEREGANLRVEKPPSPPLAKLAIDWLERRKVTHRSADDDRRRWNRYLKDTLGKYLPDEVGAAELRTFIEGKLAAGLAPNTVGNCVRLVSTFYTDLVERDLATANPVKVLPRSTRRLYRPNHDPRDTPYLEKIEDVRRVFAALPSPINVAFAIGALAGLRTSEVLGVEWADVDLDGRRITVRQQVQNGKLAPLKDDETRFVPLQAALLPILKAHKLATGGEGQLFKPARPDRGGRLGHPPRFVQIHTLHVHLAAAVVTCKLPGLTWYQATRHTFASQWVKAGGSIEKLSKILGHASVTTTEIYSHLRPGAFSDADLDMLAVDMFKKPGKVAKLRRMSPGSPQTETADAAKGSK